MADGRGPEVYNAAAARDAWQKTTGFFGRELRWRGSPTLRRAGLALIASAVAAAVVPLPPRLVDAVYSSRIYAVVQPLLTSCSNLVPVAVLDVVLVGAVLLCAWAAVRDLRRRTTWRGRLGHGLWRAAVTVSAVYLFFLGAWGFNYRRPPLIDKLQFDAAAVGPAAAKQVAASTIELLNRLHDGAHARGWGAPGAIDAELAASFARAVGDVQDFARVTVARPKRTLLDWYFRRAGVEGMTDPFFLETLVVGDALPFERPAIVAHEWSHLAGIADEGDANFVGWLACMGGSDAHRYSAALFLYSELAGSLGARDRADVAAALGPGPRNDLRAIRDRVARHLNPRIASAGWRVYDSYLKANRVEAGAASYAQVVRLVLGVKFADGWRPLRKR